MRHEGVRVGWRPNMVSQTEAVLWWEELRVTGLGPRRWNPRRLQLLAVTGRPGATVPLAVEASRTTARG